jgi:ADP-dependent NAD(P)H-hydrate dehydratase / NAD(P)H-hydrate epimerase
VTVGVPKALLRPLGRRLTEAMMLPLAETKAGTVSRAAAEAVLKFARSQDVLALGPGLSRNKSTQSLVRCVVKRAAIPMVLDADGLNAVCGHLSLLAKRSYPLMVTPHPGEFKRLFKQTPPVTQKGRLKCALQAARRFGIYVVLKGHQSVVASPQGEVFVNSTGNPGMATGGSGDVLTGVLAALLAAFKNPFEAACCAVFLHGLAGDLARDKFGEISMMAGDIVEMLPAAFKTILR